MKTGKRLLALVLVLAMMLTNLPVGAIAAEFEELAAEPTEVLMETEQATEAPVETEEPETTAVPTEAPTEAPTESSTEAVTEAPAEETTEAATEPVVVEELTATEEAVNETVAETEPEENLPYLSFSPLYDGENGLEVYTDQNLMDMVNPWGMVTLAAFWLNEYDADSGEWTRTSVDVTAGDDSITLTRVDEATNCTDFYYEVTTNAANMASSVVHTMDDGTEVSMNVGTWPHHFHFTTEASTDNSNAGLIYELDLDELSESDSVDVYAVMFHEDFTWSNVRLSEDSQRFASLYQVSDSVYRISISGEARKYVADNGYVILEVLSTQTDNNTGDVNDNGYMYLPIFMAPQTSLVMVGLGDDGDGTGYYENPDYVSFQMMFCPGKEWLCVFYLREWDAAAGEMRLSQPVDPASLQVDGDLTFTVLDPSEVQEGQTNGAYFTRVTTGTFDQDHLEVYVELDDGTRAGGVYFYTSRYFIEYYDSETRSNDTVLTEYYINPDGENVLYVGIDEETRGCTHRGVPIMDGYFGTIEETGTYGSYKITLSEELVRNALHGYPQYVQVDFEVDYEDGSYERHGAGITVKVHEEDFVPYLTYGWLQDSEEGLFEGEEHNDTGFSITPADQYCHIYYVHTWDAEQGCYVEAPVSAENLYCDDDNFTIQTITDWVKEGEVNADCFVGISAAEWDHESEIYTMVDGVRSDGVYVCTYLPQLGFYSSEEMSYNTFHSGDFIVDPDAEENAFYVGLNDDHWVIDGEPWLADENMSGLLTLTKVSDKVIKVTLTQEGIDATLGGEWLWPGIQFNMKNTVDDYTQFVDFGGICVRAESGDVTHDEEGFYFRFLEEWGEGWFDPYNGDCFGTNIAKYDEYTLFFYLKVWDAEQGQYVEIPVHPEHDQGIILNRIEDVKDGEENGEYFYAVSIADDALDTEQEVWTEYEGVTYTMPITSGLHSIAVYTTEEPSHDTRLMAPLDVEPFGENVLYLATNGDWTITDVAVDDWASEYVDLETLSDTVWQVTLTEAGINQNMSQWILDIGMNVDIQNVEDPNWTENHWMNLAFSRENLEILAHFGMESGDYMVIDGGYIREWFTGEYGSDEEGGSWEIWDSEVLADLPDGLSYDYTTNTLTMENYDGEWMCFQYGWTDDDGTFWAQLPSDTLTIELIGDNSLIAENHHALDLYGGLNAVITGDGSLLLKTVNNFFVDEWNNARVFDTFPMNGGDLTIEGNASVTVEIAGEGNESCWDGDTYLGDRTGNMTALSMGHGNLYIKDNACLETVIPEGADRNGSVDVGADNAIWDDRFPGGVRAIADASLFVSGGTLVTQGLEFGSGYHDDGTAWANRYVQTGGDVTVLARGWNNVNYEENGNEYGVEYIHTHYEGLTVRSGSSASVSGGTLNVFVEVPQERMDCSYYEAMAVRGGELTIGGDAEITIEANSESGNLVGVYCEDGTGRLNITGGTLNVNGSSGEGNGRMGIYLDHETVFNMRGGTINAEYADFMNHGPVHISGGTINIGGLYWYETMIDDRGIPYAWVTGFHAGGPEFIIDGGTINVNGGHFVAGGMVGMNGGEINITNGSLQVPTAFALNDGVVNISNPGSVISEYNGEPAHIWPALWVTTYFSIGGSDIENAAPTLNITDHQIPSMAVRVDGTYHQMAGSTVNLTHTGTEKAGIYVATQFDENGEPMLATDEEGNLILDEEGNPIILSGSFLMNDGILNVMNPGDWGAELIRAMEADPHSFVQFRGGKTTFDTAQIFWNGETHITENAVVEVKDTAIIANAGHLVMDDGTLLANEESAVCLGMSEMNGGKMELDNAMILVNAGFHFNNGEIVINNTDETINTEAVFTSLAANTYFAIGDPEDPNSNPKLTINHSLTRIPAVQVNGTMHLMAGTVEINVPVTRAPAISISGVITDENGDPLKTDDQGNPLGGEFLQNGGVLNVNAAEEESIAGIIAAADSVFFMNGGEANFNGTNMVMSGKMFLYDKALLNVNEGIVRLYETASLEVDYGTMNVTTTSAIAEDGEWAFKVEPGAEIGLKNGALTINNEAYLTALQLDGKLTLDGEAQLNVYATGTEQQYNENGEWIWRFGVYAGENSEIIVNGGTINVDTTDVNGSFVAWGEFTQTDGIMNLSVIDESGTYEGENAIETNGPTNISGGVMNLVSTDTGYSNNSAEELESGSRVNISGGTINIEVPRLAMFLCSSATISGGDINIELSNYYEDAIDENGDVLGLYRYTQGIYMYGFDNPGAVLNITGGSIDIIVNEPEQECEYQNVQSIYVLQASANITGGVIHVSGAPVFFHSTDAEDYLNLGDMAVYSRNSGKHLKQLYYTAEMGGMNRYGSGFEEDNIADDMTDGNMAMAEDLVIVTNKAGTNTTWEVNNGILTFQSTENIGGMYDYAADAPAPWYWLHDFITIAEMDTHLGYIGSYAFNGLDKLTKLVFLGEAPNFAADAFAVITADAYYPVETDSWTVEKLQDYGGEIAWLLNYESVEVMEILTDKDVLFSGEKTTLNAQLHPDLEEKPDVVWTLAEGDSDYATLTVKNNVATITAKQVTEKHIITLYAVAENGLAQPVDKTVTIYPKAQSVSIFRGDEEVTGGKIKADLDDELTLSASLNPNDAEEYLSSAVTWTSSSEKIATVDENGVVIFLTTGTVKITATANDGSKKKAVVTITVLDMIEDIELDENSVTELVGGKTASFTAYDADTRTKLKSSQVTWSISEEYAPYASITTAGKLTTKVVQEAVQVTIQATSVDDPAVSEIHVITICPAATVIQIEEGGENVTGNTIYVPIDPDYYDEENLPTVSLSAVSYPDDALTDITWKTSSKSVATVEDGIVTGVWKSGAVKTGTVTITATDANSKKSASVKLVFGVFAELVEIDAPDTTTIESGASMTLTATTSPEEITKKGVTWSLKDAADKAYLTVTTAGKVKAKTVYAPTEVTLVASSKDGYAEPAEITLTVVPKNMDMLVIKSGEEYLTNTIKTLNFNTSKTITLTAHTLSTDDVEAVTWKSSGAATATVDNGVVTFLKTGSVKITATHDDGRTAFVTVKAANLATGITVTEKSGISENLTLAAAKTMNLVATATGVTKASVTWSVEPSDYATITSAGKLTASASLPYAQVVTVTAVDKNGSGAEGSIEVLLTPQVQGIQIHGLTGELTNRTVVHDLAEDTIQLSAQTFPADAADGITWKSSNAKVAQINEATGEITCLKEGTVTITATASDGSGKKATFKLTLVKKVTSIVMSQNIAVLAGGKSLTLKADAGDATDDSVTWSMTGDTAYVTLSAKGVLKASAVTAPKTVYVTATANDGSGVTGYCTVTVYPATTAVQIWYEDEATTSKTTLEVPEGRTITLEGVSVPGNAAGVYEWKSSGTAATVEDGKVTGVTADKTVTITCTAADGSGKKATVKVKVVEAPVVMPEISLWTYPIGKWGDSATVNSLVSAFEAETGIRVNVEYLDYMTGDDKVNTAIEANSAPDLILEGPERLVANWGASGEMVNIADLFDSTDESEIYASVLDACFADETTAYQYPLVMTVHSMAINKTVFEKAGAMQYINEESHTWNSTEDFFAAVQAVYEYTGRQVGAVYCSGQGGDQGTRALVNNLYGGTYTDAENTAYTWDSAENIAALQALYNCEGIAFDPDIVGGDEISMFCNGELNMAFCWNVNQQQNPNMSNTGAGLTANGDEILFLAFPSDDTPQLCSGVWGFGIFDNGDETRIEAAKTFIKYMCDSEAAADAVRTSGFFAVRQSVDDTDLTDIWADDAVMAEYDVLMPLVGDYYVTTPGWAQARVYWWQMLQEVGMSDGTEEAIAEIVANYTELANSQ